MKAHHHRLFLAALLCVSVVACSLTGPVREDPKAADFAFRAPSASAWQPLEDKADADNAWVHKKTGATLAVRSLCRRYEHLSLQALSQNLVNTLQDVEIESQDPLAVAGRSALSTRFKGTIDGVTIQNRLVVVRKDHCIFDFTLSQLGSLSSEVQDDFGKFLESFRYEGGTAP